MTDKKKPIVEFDFIRACCAIMIIVYHYFGSSKCEKIRFFPGSFGASIVTVFFVLSGMVLYYNYSNIESKKDFYIKRFKAIYPSFWIAYFCFFVEGVFYSGDLFYHDQPWCLVFSIVGVDGYAQYKLPNYYYIGEWFLGAIIIIYLLYPLILKAFNKAAPALFSVLICLYAWIYITRFHTIYPIRSIVACLISFCFGMVIMKYREIFLERKVATIVVCVIALTVYLRFKVTDYSVQLIGLAMILILYRMGTFVMKFEKINIGITFLASISYQIFLLQHQVIDRMLGYQNYSNIIPSLIILFFTILLTVFFAWMLKTVSKEIVRVKK